MIEFPFNENKIIQVIYYLLKLNNGSFNKSNLLRALYLADKFSLSKHNWSITEDSYIMKNPNSYTPEKTLKLIENLKDIRQNVPFKYDVETNKVSISGDDPGIGLLCEADEIILQEVFNWYKEDLYDWYDDWMLDWYFNDTTVERKVPIEEILKNLGKTDEEIQEIEEYVIENII